ncbi:hypothetical protein MMC11_005978 [Xylographa trunciseda]|nr:hypothetical protein [Xylographa trunciseda]
MLYRALKLFDNLFLLFACLVEHAHPWASIRLWGFKKAPGAKTSARYSTSVPCTSPQRATNARVGSKITSISSCVDDNAADIPQIVADTDDMGIDLLLPINNTSTIECMKSEAEVEEIAVHKMTENIAVNMNNPESRSEAGISQMTSPEALITVEHGSNKEHTQIDKIEDYASGYEERVAAGKTKVEGIGQRFEDEGYVSADENSWSPETGLEFLSDQQPQMQQVVRSVIFEPLDSLEHSEVARPPLLARLTASADSVALPTLPHHQSDRNSRLSSFPSLKTFDDIPGLRRQSLSGLETTRLVTISAEATARAHHHWLRPCAACARKAGAESKGWHLLSKKKAKDESRESMSSEREAEPGMYQRTVHWVRKQEERIKEL